MPSLFIVSIASFLAGVLLCSTIFLFDVSHHRPVSVVQSSLVNFLTSPSRKTATNKYDLDGLSILVAIASYNFNQIPHLEEVLQSYRDVCEAGATVDVVIHTCTPYPVVLIDLWNSRLKCVNPSPDSGLSIKIILKQPSIKFHLADLHRELFYDHLDEYDLFVYTEDDMRVTASTLAAYLDQTKKVISLVGKKESADFNVGIVRYEYNYPHNVVIDDKTRHATANVTRVYWEHFKKPIMKKSCFPSKHKKLKHQYITMQNHHQGMFIATRYLLQQWKVKRNCNFDVIRERPSLELHPKISVEGTQRVWMSSQMLYGDSHCNVGQLLPVDTFESLTVLHLPNKNFRRLGAENRIGGTAKKDYHFVKGKDGKYFVKAKNQTTDHSYHTNQSEYTNYLKQVQIKNRKRNRTKEIIDSASLRLVTELEFHIALRKRFAYAFPRNTTQNYNGVITMVNEVEWKKLKKEKVRSKFHKYVDDSMRLYNAFISRGGVLGKNDMLYDTFSSYIH